jgi:hypothetical protein
MAGLVALLFAGCGPNPTTQATPAPNPGPNPQPPSPQGTPPAVRPPTGEPIRDPREKEKVVNDLRQIGLAYNNLWGATEGKGPARIDDLYPYLDGPRTSPSQGMATGKYVVYLNVNQAQLTQGTSGTVLAYYKDVPGAGGPVVMADGTVKSMTKEEFQAAPKAGQ